MDCFFWEKSSSKLKVKSNNKMKLPLVSLLIPIYKVENFIDRCLISLFSQTYKNIEFVFVDDCSPDNSVKHIYKLLDDYPLIKSMVKVIHHERNRGLTAARHTALLAATGEYVWHIDSDDFIAIDAVEVLVQQAVEHNADMIVFQAKEIRGNIEYFIENLIPKDKNEYLQLALTRCCHYEIWLRFCRQELYENLSFDERIGSGEDYATTPRLIFLSSIIVYLPKVCYYYIRGNENSYTATSNVSMIESHKLVMSLLSDFFFHIDYDYFYPLVIQAKYFLKVHMLKTAFYSHEAFEIARSMFPDLCDKTEFIKQLPFKDKLILFLNKRSKILLRIYMYIGLQVSQFRFVRKRINSNRYM